MGKNIGLLLLCLMLAFGLSSCFRGQEPDYEHSQSAPTPAMEPIIVSSGAIRADLVKLYPEIEALVADAEVILTGTVTAVTPCFNSAGTICQEYRVSPDEVWKDLSPQGPVADEVVLRELGGFMLARDYYLGRRDFLIDTAGAETYEKELAEFTDNDYFYADFYGISPLGEGERVLLFLTWGENMERYYTTGTAVFGQFRLTEEGVFARASDGGEYDLTLDPDRVRELAATIPDQSAALREKRSVQHEKIDGTIEEPSNRKP